MYFVAGICGFTLGQSPPEDYAFGNAVLNPNAHNECSNFWKKNGHAKGGFCSAVRVKLPRFENPGTNCATNLTEVVFSYTCAKST